MDPMYSRDECITAIKDFYEFLGKMYLDLPSAVIYPPTNGWPNITSEVIMGCLGKDREIASLLRHLPYPDSRPFRSHPDCGLPGYRLYDWKTEVDRLLEDKTDAENILWDVEGEAHYFGKRIPKHFVGLMDACRGKYVPPNVVLLDVRDGLVYWMNCPEHILKTCEPQPSRLVYPLEGETGARNICNVAFPARAEERWEDRDSDSEQEAQETPPTSDDEDSQEEEEEDDNDDDDSDDSDDAYDEIEWGPSWPIRHFFAMLKNEYMKLNWIPYNDQTVIDIDESQWPDEALEQAPRDIPRVLQSIYHKHGWPDLEGFDKEACLVELKKVVAEKYPLMHTYWLLSRQ
ncbi:hypothetical protein E8E13_002650 [Curvularia kusanoi]|uniref:Uncharacterized protein n=1 Tax=Curvularia kusanoi TaxID=90978 RepID=A0A9P4TGX6_CURKU|nr:hypothetical protein E8E13_002650 [Curvularia kusanoi]